MGKTNKRTATSRIRPASPARSTKDAGLLTKKELAEFRAMLLEKRRSILADMGGLEAEISGGPERESSAALNSVADHPADFGTDCHEMEMTVGLLANEMSLLREIAEALDRIDRGTYGVCLATGNPIGKARLHARPWAKYCIEHARQMEKGGTSPRYSRAANEGMRISAGAPDDTADKPESDIDLEEADRL